MPTYDYACQNCGHEFEEFQSISADPLIKCPKCGKRSLKRLIGTGGGVIFKGSGFYQTDYRSESYKKAADADKPAAPKPESDSGADSSSASVKAAGDKGDANAGASKKPAAATPSPAPRRSSAKKRSKS
ncbi:MAG: zinc ribbon domain-containing protein [Phycisphaerae bacterium]